MLNPKCDIALGRSKLKHLVAKASTCRHFVQRGPSLNADRPGEQRQLYRVGSVAQPCLQRADAFAIAYLNSKQQRLAAD